MASTLTEPVLSHVRLLLDARAYEEEEEGEDGPLCDFTLKDQREAAISKGVVQPSSASSAAMDDFVPVLKKSVTYIVAAVLVNQQGEVLMMQVSLVEKKL